MVNQRPDGPICSCIMQEYYGDDWSNPQLHQPPCAFSRIGTCFACERNGILLTADIEIGVTFTDDTATTKMVRVCEDCYIDIQTDAEDAAHAGTQGNDLRP